MQKHKLIEHYDQKYDQESSSNSGIDLIPKTSYPASRFEAAVHFIPNFFLGGKVLEIGAGSGNVALSLLTSQLNIEKYTLSDFSKPRLEGLKRNISDKRVSIIELDADNIPSNFDMKYDAIIMIALIEHLIDPLAALQKVHHFLNSGGFVYIDTPNIAKYSRRLKLLTGYFPSTASKNEGLTTYSGQKTDLYDDGHLHYFTYRSLSKMLLERCGFSRIKKLGYSDRKISFLLRPMFMAARVWPEMFSEIVIIAYK